MSRLMETRLDFFVELKAKDAMEGGNERNGAGTGDEAPKRVVHFTAEFILPLASSCLCLVRMAADFLSFFFLHRLSLFFLASCRLLSLFLPWSLFRIIFCCPP